MSVPHTNLKSPRARRRAGVRNLARRVDGRSYAPACVSPRRKCNESRPQTQAVVTILARRFHRNQQYSIVALTNGGGTITERYAYDAYGTPTVTDAAGTTLTTSVDNNRYTYTGREFDEALGLYHYRARMYDSVAGRFCSRDPIGYLDGPMQYQYVGANPATRVDPGGLFSFFPGGGTVLPTGPDDLWDFPEFAWHYFFGGGTPYSVDAEDMQTFIAGSSNAMGALRGMARKSAFDAAQCGQTVRTHGNDRMNGFGLNVPKGSLWAFFQDKHILNTGTADVSWSCTTTKQCCDDGGMKSLSVSCTVNVQYRDRFANPFDIGGEYHEHDPVQYKKCTDQCDAEWSDHYQYPLYWACKQKCEDDNPFTDHLGTPFNIFGEHSESFNENFSGTCCD